MSILAPALTQRRKSNPGAAAPVVLTETIQGIVARQVFYNAENGYCILAVRPTSGGPALDEDIKMSGNMPSVREAGEYRFTGHWSTHPMYGAQFKFTEAEAILPTGTAGVARYLATITFGVGAARAKRIVDTLGDDCLAKIKEDPAVLDSLDFLTEYQRQDIAEDLDKNSVQAELAGIICRDGIGRGMVARIYNKFGTDSVEVVKGNPYILCDEVWGVGFKKADAVAHAVGIKPDSPFRVESAVNFALNEAGNDGHVFLKPSNVVTALVGKKGLIEASGVEVTQIAKASQRLIDAGKCVREGDSIYPAALYSAERGVASAVKRLLAKGKSKVDGLDEMIDAAQAQAGVQYAVEQREAVRMALASPVSIVTGGPGVGKTTVINVLCNIYRKVNPHHALYLAAPTGRAAKRMGEATDRDASTIHRLLRYNPQYNGFEYGYGKPLPGPGMLVVDESSMIDIRLAASLLSAVEDLRVVFVGDIDQLPSVGPGSVLRDCIASGLVPTTRLEFNFRQAGGSKIAEYAHLVCRGQVPPLANADDFEFVAAEDADQAAAAVMSLVGAVLADGYGQMEFQVLAPMYRGSCGVKALNEAVRNIINPAAADKPALGEYRVGDKVMVIKNNYQLGVFNGDIGQVATIEKGVMAVNFGDFTQNFGADDLGLLTLAYAATIHKSQGSEFPLVIMPLVRQHYMMLQRNLLYTGMTRAKKRLVLVADPWAVKKAVANNKIEERFSLLAERIRGGNGSGSQKSGEGK